MNTHNYIELLKQQLLIANAAHTQKKVSENLLAEIDHLTAMLWALLQREGANREQLEAELVEEMNLMNAAQAAKKNNNPVAYKHAMERYKAVYERNCKSRGVEIPPDYWDNFEND